MNTFFFHFLIENSRIEPSTVYGINGFSLLNQIILPSTLSPDFQYRPRDVEAQTQRKKTLEFWAPILSSSLICSVPLFCF